MNEISKKSAGVFAHAQGFVLIADVIELGEYKGLRSVLFIPSHQFGPLQTVVDVSSMNVGKFNQR